MLACAHATNSIQFNSIQFSSVQLDWLWFHFLSFHFPTVQNCNQPIFCTVSRWNSTMPFITLCTNNVRLSVCALMLCFRIRRLSSECFFEFREPPSDLGLTCPFRMLHPLTSHQHHTPVRMRIQAKTQTPSSLGSIERTIRSTQRPVMLAQVNQVGSFQDHRI